MHGTKASRPGPLPPSIVGVENHLTPYGKGLQVSATPQPFETQNLHDDDGQVIDSFFIETDTPPDLKPAAQTVPSAAVEEPAVCTKTLTETLFLDPAIFGPVQLLPEDKNRQGFTLRVSSPTAVATDGIRIASDKGLLSKAGRLFHGQQTNGSWDQHTGPVYIQTCKVSDGNGVGAASAPIAVDWWAITV